MDDTCTRRLHRWQSRTPRAQNYCQHRNVGYAIAKHYLRVRLITEQSVRSLEVDA